MTPAVSSADQPDVETSGADYASRFRGTAGRYLLQVQSQAVANALRGLPAGSALDVGGAHGQLVELLNGLGFAVTVHGTDASCERNLRELHQQHQCAFICGPLTVLPATNQSYDLVIAVRLLSHVPDWQQLVAEMCRVARRSVVLDYPSKSGLNALTPLLFGLKKSLEGNTRSYASFSAAELRAEFQRHGFVCARSVRQFVMPMVVHRMAQGAAPLRWLESLFRFVGLTALLGSPVILRMDRR